MRIRSRASTGVRSVTDPKRWVVAPLPMNASLHDVVEHFLDRRPQRGASTADHVAYCRAYAAALEAAPKNDLTGDWQWRWYEDLRDSVGRCITAYQTHGAK
jgi:hypothetical protein